MQFDCLAPFHGMELASWMTEWDASWVNTYLLLKEDQRIADLREELPAFEKKYLGEGEDFSDLLLQPLLATHLDSGYITHDYFNAKKFSRKYVRRAHLCLSFSWRGRGNLAPNSCQKSEYETH